MKKIITTLMIVSIFLSFVACEPQEVDPTTNTTANPTTEKSLPTEDTQETSTATVPVSEENTEATQGEQVEQQGDYTWEEIMANRLDFDNLGIWIRYSDNTFTKYEGGYVLRYDEQPMVYGTDKYPDDLIMIPPDLNLNLNNIDGGELVLYWPKEYETNLRSGLFKVTESGWGLDGGPWKGCALATANGSICRFELERGLKWDPIDYVKVNGIDRDEFVKSEMFVYAQENGNEFASFTFKNDYVLETVEGTSLAEMGYTNKVRYFLYDDANEVFSQEALKKTGLTSYSTIPTKDGYAILDFSDVEPGEYVFVMSFWAKYGRKYYSTLIAIGDDGQVTEYDPWFG